MQKKIVWLPYDMDTAIGINNEGDLVFGYELEDIDQTESGADVYNGQKSVIWKNLREAFYADIKSMYQTLRSSGALSYAKVEQMFEEHQDKWCEAIFNEDSMFKYIDPLIESGTGTYLAMLQGSKAEQRKWWLYNRFRYIDSKYNAGDAASDTIIVREYAVADITVTPYADIYATIKYGSYLQQVRAIRGQSYTIHNPLDEANDTEVAIYSASQIASVGDLSGLKVGLADFSNATRLQSVKLGDASSTYENRNLGSGANTLTFGNNILLDIIDVRNCTSLGTGTQKVVDISNCSNIEYVYFDGTKVQGVTLPNGGIMKVLHLPGTITNLTIMNQKQITDFTCPSLANVSTLRLENNGSGIDSKAIFNTIPTGARVRLIGFTWEATDSTEIEDILDRLDDMMGLDEYGNNMDKAQVSGIIHTSSLTGAQIASYSERYPYLTVTADNVTSVLTYANYNGTSVYKTVNCINGVPQDTAPADPTRSQTAQYTYTFVGWSKSKNSTTADSDAATNVIADRTIYAAFSTTLRYYTVRFYNGTELLQTSTVAYGGTAVYSGEEPVHTDPEDYEFGGWNPSPVGITGDTDCQVKWVFVGSVTRKVIGRTIKEISNSSITVVGENAFNHCSTLSSVNLPSATTIGVSAFRECYYLTYLSLPMATSLDDYAFYGCSSLTYANLPAATDFGRMVFSNCSKLAAVDLPVLENVNYGAFTACRSLTSVSIPMATTIGSFAFQSCSSLTSISLPMVTSIDLSGFQGCSRLASVYLLASSVCKLGASVFITTPLYRSSYLGYYGSIYVPSSLVDTYKSSTNWATYADRITAYEGE